MSDPSRALRHVIVCLVFSSLPAFAQRYSNHYELILADPPVLDRFPAREAARSAAGSVAMSSNSIFVAAAPERFAELRALPEVTGVIRMRMFRSKLNRATQLMNAPAAWNLLGGASNAGASIKIAILDSGIDQTHPAFQDPSPPPGFPICTANHPEDCAYTNTKVIVARSYVRQIVAPSDPTNPAADSSPDDDSPRDS